MSGINGEYASVPFGVMYTMTWEGAEKTVFAISHLGPPKRKKRRPVAT